MDTRRCSGRLISSAKLCDHVAQWQIYPDHTDAERVAIEYTEKSATEEPGARAGVRFEDARTAEKHRKIREGESA